MVRSAVTVCLVPEAAAGPFVFHGDLPGACASAARLGFDAVEVFAPDAAAVKALGLKPLLTDNNLSLAALGTGAGFLRHKLTLTDASDAVRSRAIDYVRAMLDAAAEFGCAVIVGSMQGRWSADVPRDRAVGYLGEALALLGDYAAKLGVTLLFEPLNRYESNLFDTQQDGCDFLNGLDNPAVKQLADLFHMNIEEWDTPGALRSIGKRLGHVHFADSNRQAAGYGQTNFAPIRESLREAGFAGYLSAEVLPIPDSEHAAEQAIRAFRYFFPPELSCL